MFLKIVGADIAVFAIGLIMVPAGSRLKGVTVDILTRPGM